MRFFDAGEFYVEVAEGAREMFVVDAEDVEHRSAQVAEVDGVFGDVVAEVVGGAEFDAEGWLRLSTLSQCGVAHICPTLVAPAWQIFDTWRRIRYDL
jgi:hypothetical protein